MPDITGRTFRISAGSGAARKAYREKLRQAGLG